MSDQDIATTVKEKYGQVALRITSGGGGCCGPQASAGECDPITSNLYAADEAAGLPAEAVQASLGCGNPVALAELTPGETVLDLGSGGGIDVLLSAKRVGPTGKAYGLDMTDEMLALARENQVKAGVENVEFLKGEIEAIPLPDASVDVVISNCVINLSADKRRVFAEAFRVLKPGGRFAVSDIVVKGEVPVPIRKSMEAWAGCFAGVLGEDEFRALLAEAGFETVEVEPTRIYRAADVRQVFEGYRALLEEIGRQGLRLEDLLAEADGKYRSAFIRAVKPTSFSSPM
jgi:ubiquinone/menaquinone biosynthesis C-methylase UbiE